MKIVVDILLKLIQIVVMPLVLKVLDNVFKYFHEKYKKDEAFKERIDSLLRGLAAKVDPVKLMQLFMEYKNKAAARDAEKKAEAKQKKAEADQKKAAARQAADTDSTPDAADSSDEPDLAETATETARLGIKASKRAGQRAAGFLNRWGRKAGDWLKEETGLNEDESDPIPGEGTEEDQEIDRLKRKLREDEERVRREVQPEQPTEPPVPADKKKQAPTQPNPPAPVAPARPGEKKPADGKKAERTENADEGTRAPKNTEDTDGGEIGFADELEKMLRKEREKRDPNK